MNGTSIKQTIFLVLVLGATLLAPTITLAEDAAGVYSLEDAYKKEYAFLEIQKRDLQERLAKFKQRSQDEQIALNKRIGALSDQVVAIDTDIQQIRDDIEASERALNSSLDLVSLLEGTIEQGQSALDEYQRKPDAEAFATLRSGDKVRLLFSEAGLLIEDLSKIRRAPGAFYLSDGSRTEGEILRLGNIAAFGISDKESGALAPAGGGEYKLWPDSGSETAKALAAGETPQRLSLFLYESLQKEVQSEGQKSLFEYINDGGVIGWVIVSLGILAVLLLMIRTFILKIAGGDTGFVLDKVAGLVKVGKPGEALELCEERNGCASKVVTATLHNLNLDKEQLDDMITEKILSESSRLERFGPFILIIAGVTPLLGLLGTVTGMISTFDVITEFGTGDPKMLSGGIATALVTTQLGLTVAIPTLLCGSLLTAWGNRIKDDMERIALHIITRIEMGKK